MNQILMDVKAEINSNTIIVGSFNTPLTSVDRPSRQKINKEIMALSATLAQIDSIDIFRTYYPNTANYTFFSSAHGTFSRTAHILSHKSSLNKLKKIEIISSIFSDYSCMKLEINYRKQTGRNE